ncbi:MAG: N-acetylglucosamine-6-phosphate deacetylase, partial [Erysipelotrichaceae bacterium]|nr:N-acetylglucosamine-6-phosphate deacetylase [Erysipelotrichaceae bacterium]
MIIQSKRVYIADTLIPAQLQIEGDKIVAVYRYNEKPVDKDYGDRRILPGFYDLHTHGYMGYDTTDGG